MSPLINYSRWESFGRRRATTLNLSIVVTNVGLLIFPGANWCPAAIAQCKCCPQIPIYFEQKLNSWIPWFMCEKKPLTPTEIKTNNDAKEKRIRNKRSWLILPFRRQMAIGSDVKVHLVRRDLHQGRFWRPATLLARNVQIELSVCAH